MTSGSHCRFVAEEIAGIPDLAGGDRRLPDTCDHGGQPRCTVSGVCMARRRRERERDTEQERERQRERPRGVGSGGEWEREGEGGRPQQCGG